MVRGVRVLLWVFDNVPVACRVDELKREELELSCELAEPTVLRVSPVTDSASSVW